jgi:glycosyltransferase involved in cell wall biosynthesis
MLQQKNGVPAIYYVWHPEHQEVVEGIVGGPLVYHCYDRYAEYTDVPRGTVEEWERWLVGRASVCIAASRRIADYLRGLGARDVLLLRHGIDTAVFRPDASPHPALCGIPGPRLGLIASLTDSIDVRTLTQVARQRPGWSLVIVGGVSFQRAEKRSDFEALCRLPNVHHMGLRPKEEIPTWIAGFDVCLMCYDLASWAPYKQPLKMYEYLACGVPVVSSDIEAAQELGNLVERASAPDQWVPIIERTLAQDGPAQIERRTAFARANSWERRVGQLEAVLLQISGHSGLPAVG